MHFEILVEDSSGKKALDILMPKILGDQHTFRTCLKNRRQNNRWTREEKLLMFLLSPPKYLSPRRGLRSLGRLYSIHLSPF